MAVVGSGPAGFYAAGVVRDLSTAVHRWVLYDIDFRTGRIRWERVLHQAPPAQTKHQKNSYASETPVTDGERVYAYLANALAEATEKYGGIYHVPVPLTWHRSLVRQMGFIPA